MNLLNKVYEMSASDIVGYIQSHYGFTPSQIQDATFTDLAGRWFCFLPNGSVVIQEGEYDCTYLICEDVREQPWLKPSETRELLDEMAREVSRLSEKVEVDLLLANNRVSKAEFSSLKNTVANIANNQKAILSKGLSNDKTAQRRDWEL